MLIVQKFGGSSLADAQRIRRAAQRVAQFKRAGHGVVVVVSAQGQTTDELIAKGQKANLAQILKEIQQRDYQDMNRAIAPLKQAKDAVKVDTSGLDIEGVVEAIKAIVKDKIGV